MTCHQLQLSLAEITHIDPHSVLVKRIVGVSDSKSDLKTILVEDQRKTLEAVGLKHGDSITVEDIYSTESNFDATRHLNQVNEPKNEAAITVKIENKTFGKVSKGGAVAHDIVSIEIDKESTIE